MFRLLRPKGTSDSLKGRRRPSGFEVFPEDGLVFDSPVVRFAVYDFRPIAVAFVDVRECRSAGIEFQLAAQLVPRQTAVARFLDRDCFEKHEGG